MTIAEKEEKIIKLNYERSAILKALKNKNLNDKIRAIYKQHIANIESEIRILIYE